MCYNVWDKPPCKSPHPLVKHFSAEELNPRYDVEGGKHAGCTSLLKVSGMSNLRIRKSFSIV
jgi:hypothetical protein